MKATRRKGHSTPRLNEMVRGWNLHFPVGTPVSVKLDNGKELETVTRSPAWVVGGHSALISVRGLAGGYLLERIRAL